MPFSSVVSRFTVSGYPAGSNFPTLAMQTLATIYDGSPLAAAAIDNWLNTHPGQNIEIRFLSGAAQAYANLLDMQGDSFAFENTFPVRQHTQFTPVRPVLSSCR